jgi:hypothetical protein
LEQLAVPSSAQSKKKTCLGELVALYMEREGLVAVEVSGQSLLEAQKVE